MNDDMRGSIRAMRGSKSMLAVLVERDPTGYQREHGMTGKAISTIAHGEISVAFFTATS